MKRLLTLALGSLAALLAAGSTGRADQIAPVYWNYDWDRTPVTVNGSPAGGVFLSNEQARNAKDSSDILATNVFVVGVNDDTAPPVTIDPATSTYTLRLKLRLGKKEDVPQGTPATLEFTGKLGGSFSFLNSNVTNSFTGATTKTAVVDDVQFTVTVGPYTPPGILGGELNGSIGAHVDVRRIDTHVNKVPEPTTLLLSCLGLSGFGLARWRRRR